MMGVFSWINTVSGFTYIEFILLGIYFGLYFGFFGLICNFLFYKKRVPFIVIAPVAWVSMEFLRSHAGFLSFPWALLGHSQYQNLFIIQIASFTGAYGISFLIVMVNAFFSDLYFNYMSLKIPGASSRAKLRNSIPIASLLITVFSLLITLIYGLNALSHKRSEDTLTITVIQGNIPNEMRWKTGLQRYIFSKHVRLSREAFNSGKASIIVWPESSVPGPLPYYRPQSEKLRSLARETDSYLLVGTSYRPKFKNKYRFKKKEMFNSVLLHSPDGKTVKRYNKIHLVPFSEYLPYRNSFPWSSRYTSVNEFTQGTEYTIFESYNRRFGVLICWENIFPILFRQFVKKGAEFIINITNEARLNETPAPYQLMAISVFRAVENRIPVVRAANTGISCFIDSYGRIIGKVQNHDKDIFVEGYLTKQIPLSHKRSFYTLYGDVFIYGNITFLVMLFAISLFTIPKKIGKH
jgi:apolipoprotein N-acyltransferase